MGASDAFALMHLAQFRELSTRQPWLLISVTLLLAAAGGYLYIFKLRIVSDRKQLISRDIESNRRYLDFIDDFGDNEIIILAICAGDQPEKQKPLPTPTPQQRKAMKQVATDWAVALRQRPDMFPKVYERTVWPRKDSPALLYLGLDELRAFARIVRENQASLTSLTRDPSLANQFTIANRLLKKAGTWQRDSIESYMPQALQAITAYLKEITAAVSRTADAHNGKPATDFDWASLLPARYDPEGFFFSENGRLLTVYAHVQGQSEQRNRYAQAMTLASAAMQSALVSAGATTKLSAGIAGMPALESGELETTQADFTRAALMALVCVTLLFIVVFGGLLRPLLGVLCLGCAIGMTFGFTWLVVGHLNILAMIFAVILVALGIDFAIHFLTHYEHLLAGGITPALAVQNTYSAISGALWMGGLTTSAAFLSACLTDFTGLVELGLIAGTGLFFCLLCMYFTFPALLIILDNKFPNLRQHIRSRVASSATARKILAPLLNKRTALIVVSSATLLTLLCLVAGRYDLDTNLLSLQAEHGQANLWQQILIKNDDRSLFAVSTATSRDEIETLQRRYLQERDVVRRVDALFPFQETEKRRILQSVDSTLSAFKPRPRTQPSVSKLKRQIWNFRQQLRKVAKLNSTLAIHLAPVQEQVDGLYKALDADQQGMMSGLSELEQDLALQIHTAVDRLAELCRPGEISAQRLPNVLRERLRSPEGELAMFIYPAENTWLRENLNRFVKRLREIDPHVMGELVSLHDNGNSLVRSFMQASGYSLMVIIFLLLVWTRSIRDTLLALLPLTVGVALLVAAMRIWPTDLSWNFTNFFGLPIIIGIGVDSGIHLVRSWRAMDPAVFDGAVKAVAMSSATTIIGFGILATSAHLGVRSLGTVLCIGIFGVLLSAMTVLPATLFLLRKENNHAS